MTNNTKSNPIYVQEMIPYQDWKYVEVVRDFHKHLGTDASRARVRMLNDTVKQFKSEHSNAQNALRWLSLAAIGGLITPLCQRALEMVREHSRNQVAEKAPKPQATKEEILQAWIDPNPSSPTEKKMAEKGCTSAETIDAETKQRNTTSPDTSTKQQDAAKKSSEDWAKEVIFGSVEKSKEIRNDYFGFDLDKALDMGIEEYMHYLKECKKVGWRNVRI